VTVFAEYAPWYDLLYRDKDYAGEAAYVHRLLGRPAAQSRALLELGSGTGRHAIELARRGYSVTGVDSSERMVALARAAQARLPERLRRRLEFRRGDATAYSPTGAFDAVIALFHVVNYQLSARAVAAMFRTARAALDVGGLFVFDFWHGPGVRADRPVTRVKRVTVPGMRLLRVAEPEMDLKRNIVTVNYTLFVTRNRGKRISVLQEKHRVRCLFLPELARLARSARFSVVKTGEWMTGKPLSQRAWLGYAVLRAVEERGS